MPRRTFMVVRLPALVLAALLLLFGIGFGGWHFYNLCFAAPPAEGIRLRMRENIENLRSYYASFKTTLLNVEEEASYHVEIWKGAPDRYRLEMTRVEEGKEAILQVVIYDGARTYLYNPELGDFLAVQDLERPEIPYLVLEDYWNAILEAGQFNLLSEDNGTRHRYYLVEIFPREPHRYRVREIVWLEAKSLLPGRIEVYDAYDCITQITTFEIIQLNPSLEAALFQVDAGTFVEAGE